MLKLARPQASRARAEIARRAAPATAEDPRYDWPAHARPNQLAPPPPWTYWLILAGRGFGKTRTGAEQVRIWARDHAYVNLIGATADDARDIMIEGESGILAVCPDRERPAYVPSKRRLEWPNGARSLIFTADEPDRLRGKQHLKLWADELAAWRYPEAWDQAMFGLRLGDNPQAVITTTPKPGPILKALLADRATVTTRGSTYENRANLAPSFFDKIVGRYEGTRLGRQELDAELLEDVEGALWGLGQFDGIRIPAVPDGVTLKRVVVPVDPSGGDAEGNDEQGIVAVGLGSDGLGYVLGDHSTKDTPGGWGRAAVLAALDHEADAILAETNFGGDMVITNIRAALEAVGRELGRTLALPVRKVVASRGKRVRAEPVAALYEQGRVRHVGPMPALESQMATWTPESARSPDRLDALVMGLTDLMLGPNRETRVIRP